MVELSPTDTSNACPVAFAAALTAIRDGFGVSTWPSFCEKLYEETAKKGTAVRIGRGAIEPYASSSPSRVKPPGVGLLRCLELPQLLYFENGDPVTVQALTEIYYCQRLPSGDFIERSVV